MTIEGDCLDLMRSLPSESIDCVFADPPFNLGKHYNNGKSDLLAEDHYLDWCRLWITESIRLLKSGGAIFVYNLPRWAYQIAAYLEEQEMEFRHWIAVSMKGTFPRGNKLYPAHYALLYFTKGIPKTFNRVRLPIPACRHCGKDIKDYGGHRNISTRLASLTETLRLAGCARSCGITIEAEVMLRNALRHLGDAMSYLPAP